MNFYGSSVVTSTGSRASRYLAVDNVTRAVTGVSPRLQSYSWTIEHRAQTPITTVSRGQYTITVQYQFRIVFKQVITKTFTQSLTGDAMSSGFDFTADTSTGQSKAYPDVSELRIFDLPQIWTDADFEGLKRDWHIASYDISCNPDTGINTLQATLMAKSFWKNYTQQSSKCVLPSISSITTVSDFP